MPTTDQIIQAMHEATLIEVPRIEETVRRIRAAPHHFFVRQTKSPKSPRPGARDIAALTIALASALPMKAAPQAVQTLSLSKVDTVSLLDEIRDDYDYRFLQETPLGSTIKNKAHSFIDALTALVDAIVESEATFVELRETRIDIDTRTFLAFIDLKSRNGRVREIGYLPADFETRDTPQATFFQFKTVVSLRALKIAASPLIREHRS